MVHTYCVNGETIDTFFTANEKSTNIILSKALLFALLVYPLIIAGIKVGVLFNENMTKLYIFSCCVAGACVGNYLYCRKTAERSYVKYVCFASFEIIVFFLSTFRGFGFSVTYALPALISCLYFKEQFTLKISAAGFVCMWGSLAIRSKHQLPFFTMGQTPSEWFAAVGLGASVEYGVISLFLYYVAKTARISLTKTLLRKLRIQRMGAQIIEGFANIVESKDETTGEHIMRTGAYVRLICNKLIQKKQYSSSVNEHTAEIMVQAAPFHDLGKLSVPDHILNKPGRLTPEEFAVIRRHPYDGAHFILNSLSGLESNELIETACNMSLCHHERLDGNGYPFRLVADEIPVSARIMSAADILDALLMRRPYKEPFSIDKALSIIEEMSGSALDPQIVDTLLESKDEIASIAGVACDGEDFAELETVDDDIVVIKGGSADV